MNRLDLICSLVKENSTVCDIGCDHGYLLLKLYPKIKQGFALDIAKKPLDSAIKTINQNNISDKITAILSDGLEKVDPNITDTIVIAGMGAELICNILSKHNFVYNNKFVFLLQPMTKPELLRQWLFANGFDIIEEKISIEERRCYSVVKTSYTGIKKSYDITECFISEPLLCDKNINAYLNQIISKMHQASKNITDSSNENFIYFKNMIDKLKGYKND